MIFAVAICCAVIISVSYPLIRSHVTPYKAVGCVVTSVGSPDGKVSDRWKMEVQTDGCGELYTSIDSPYSADGSFDLSSWKITKGETFDFMVEGFQWEPVMEITGIAKKY